MPSEATSASVPRIGAELITGEAMRTRRRAEPIAFAIRCASSHRDPGRTRRACRPAGAVSMLAGVGDVARRPELLEVLAVAGRDAGESTVTMTFSSRVQESAVQFVEPVQTEAPSRTTYLWCMRSGTPGIAAVGKGLSLDRVGVRARRRRDRHLLRVVEVVREADGDAAFLRGDERAARRSR